MTKTIFEKRYIQLAQCEAAIQKEFGDDAVNYVAAPDGRKWMVLEIPSIDQAAPVATQSARQETEAFIKDLQDQIQLAITDAHLDHCMALLNGREPKLEEAIFVAIDEMIGRKREALELTRMEIEAEEQANRAQIEGVSQTKGGKLWIKASSVEKPTKLVWVIADEMCALAEQLGRPHPSRKEVQEECVRRGIASGTARTQYQHWFKTNHEAASAPRATIGADGKIVPASKG